MLNNHNIINVFNLMLKNNYIESKLLAISGFMYKSDYWRSYHDTNNINDLHIESQGIKLKM